MLAITEKMLIPQLKELETDKLVLCDIKTVVSPRVTYRLTAAVMELARVMQAMAEWELKFPNSKIFTTTK